MSVRSGQTTPKKAINLDAEREKDKTPVRGMFKFYEVPGGSIEFSYKKYKDEPVITFKGDKALKDGEVYTVPLGIAKHLNKSGWYPVHTYAQDENGQTCAKIGHKVRRYGFQSLEFVDIDDLTPEGSGIITVEKTI